MGIQHTPGPWKFDKEYGNAMDEVYGSDGRAVAAVWTRRSGSGSTARPAYKPVPEFMANARLIAAAPELLEALKQAVYCIDNRRGDVSQDTWDRMIDAAKAAIARATGEQ